LEKRELLAAELLATTPQVAILAQHPAALPVLSQPEAEPGVETALDRYVAKADPSYKYELVNTFNVDGATVYLIDMTSQTWRSPADVNRTVWQHWLQIIVPNNTVSDTAILSIGGGSNSGRPPSGPNPLAIQIARQTGMVTIDLPTVPNQSLTFTGDPNNPRSEDAILAYSYHQFLEGGDEEWPAILPMVKSAVAAMDTTQDFLHDRTPVDINDFVVTGGSKRGWTTWLTAAVDPRVSAIAPAVIDVLNIEASMRNHRQNYDGVTDRIIGGYARAVGDYTAFGIFDQSGTPRGQELMSIIDPYQYRDRLTMPKYIVNSSGDQFFTPDSSLFYFEELVGPSYLRYVPNTDHSLSQDPTVAPGIAAFFTAVDAGAALPQFDWEFEGEFQNTIRLTTQVAPLAVKLWQATNPESLDFRLETAAPRYTSTPLISQGGGEYVGTVPVPNSGGTAYFVEVTYLVNGTPLTFTTQAAIVEAVLPELVAIRPDAGPLLNEGDTLHVAPREFNLLFSGGANLDAATINTDTVKLIRSGGDGTFDDGNEVEVALGYVGLPDPFSTDGADRQQIVVRPASVAVHNATNPAFSLPDDDYQLHIIGAGDAPLKNVGGAPFQGGENSLTSFRLDLGTQVIAIDPQPIDIQTRTQAGNQIVVYFDDQTLDPSDAIEPKFYRLVDTAATLDSNDDQTKFPQSVLYDPIANTATLIFATAIPTGTYRLDIGRDEDLIPPARPLGILSTGNAFVDNDNNSTFGTSISIGVLKRETIQLAARIQPQSIALPPRPGSEDDPGHRQIQREQHIGAIGTDASLPAPISIRSYHFPTIIGRDSNGVPYPNLISEAEKQIVREIYEIYAQLSGFEFVETASGGTWVGKGDLRALNPAMGPDSGVAGLGGAGSVLLNGAVFAESTRFFGDGFTNTMFHEIGHSLGLNHAYDQPANMGGGVPNDVLPGDHDVVHLQRIVPPNSTDIDMYRFDLDEPGRVQIETIAERLSTPSLLNAALRLYRKDGDNFELVAQNDQYFGADSFLDLALDVGSYFIGVTSTGNTQYDPLVPDSGYGGTTDGVYQLQITFDPARPDRWLTDADGTAIDGDADGTPGGVYSFWFQASDEATTIYVDKANDLKPNILEGSGALDNPFDNLGHALRIAGSRIVVPTVGPNSIADGESFVVDDGVNAVMFTFGGGGANSIDISSATSAIQIANQIAAVINSNGLLSGVRAEVVDHVVQINGIEQLDLAAAPTLMSTPNAVRVLGNAGRDGDLATLADNRPYLIGVDASGRALADGSDFLVPQAVTVMFQAGALLKMRKTNLDAGTSAVGVNRRAGAIQVLGTPGHPVYLRSFHDDSVGGNSDGAGPGAAAGNFGGIVFRDDSDLEAAGVFLNYVNHADIKHGGGKVFVGAQESVYTPVHLIDARPTVSFNHIWTGADAAISASPDSFEETNRRVGPDIVGNYLANNTINALFIRVLTPLGSTLNELTVSGRLDDTDITHVLTENLIINGGAGGPTNFGVLRARPSGRLLLDPGTVLKLSEARIEAERGGGALIAEGTPDRPVIFTSLADDRYGGSGSFDTDRTVAANPQPGDWGGLYFGAGTSGSLDHASISFAGGITPIEGGAAAFNAIEVHQADLRIAASRLQYNADGDANDQRNGRGVNFPAVIYVRGAQPIIIDNQITDNFGPAININASSLRWEVQPDSGRSTGLSERYQQYDDNHGPLTRLNRLENNRVNGMVIRGEELTTKGIWDDTDIVHVLFNEVLVDNHHHVSGLTLQSSNSESLVVKFDGLNAGLTATGTPQEIIDRIGGTIQVLGTIGHPVVLTHLSDDSVGAGFTPGGEVMFDTDNLGPSVGQAGNWRGLRFDEFSNDRNVAVVREIENSLTGGRDINPTPLISQGLGTLAPNEKSGDENRRLGFEVSGFISPDDPGDIDVYNFNATAGTPIWIDIDRTDPALDAIVEVVNENGIVLARSLRSGNLLAPGTLNAQPLTQEQILGGDHDTQNFRDPGLYYVLPGTPGSTGTYFVRVRSNPAGPGGVTSFAGQSRGAYTLQIRLRQIQEFPGSTVKFADIRYADIGIDVHGLPAHSPLVGEAGELPTDNDIAINSQVLVNLLETDMAAISIAGGLSSSTDVDWYAFNLKQTGVQEIPGFNDSSGTIAVVFDVDYADGAVRGDTSVAVYEVGPDENPRLVYIGRESNVIDDQPTSPTDPTSSILDLGRGSLGKKDAYIGPVQLTPGNRYLVAMMSNAQLPGALSGVFQAVPVVAENALVRLEPVNSVERIVEDHIGQQGYVSGGTIAPRTTAGIFSLEDGQIGSHIGPFNLADVALFIATENSGLSDDDSLYTANPFASGPYRTRLTNSLIDGDNDLQDLVIRSDGRMFGYQQLDDPGNHVGALVELDPNNFGTVLSTQNDNITNDTNTAGVAQALTFKRIGTNASASPPAPIYNIFYAVDEFDSAVGATVSRLYLARENGDAAPPELPEPPLPAYGLIGNIQSLESRFASADLLISNGADPVEEITIRIKSKNPVTVELPIEILIARPNSTVAGVQSVVGRTITLQIGGTGSPRITDAPTAQAIVDAINSSPQASALVSAELVAGTGTGGTKAVELARNALSLRIQPSRVTGLAMGDFLGRTELFAVTNAGEFLLIDQENGNVIRRLDVSAALDTAISFTGLTLGPQNVNGGDLKNTLFASTDTGEIYAFDTTLVHEIPIDLVFDPSLPRTVFDLLPRAGNPNFSVANTAVFDDPKNAVSVSGTRVTVTPSVYAAPGAPATIHIKYDLVDGSGVVIPQTATVSIGDAVSRTAEADEGIAVVRRIFDANQDGVAESQSAHVSEMSGSTVGLAFSPLDFSLWHPTNKRGGDSPADFGHGVNPAPDNTRPPVAGETSFHFGFEQWSPDPTDAYLQHNGINAQYGILTPEYHADLSSNPNIVGTYNFPGGALGSLQSGSFSLAGSTAADRPTLYFNYFLDTEDHPGANIDSDGDDPFRDSARVFISRDGGVSWELVATNNSVLSDRDPNKSRLNAGDALAAELPGFLSHLSDAGFNSSTPRPRNHQIVQEMFDSTGVWRQARVDLSTFAGEANVMLRFDFSTAGAMGDPALGNVEARFGELTSRVRSITSLNNAFEGFYIDDIIVGFAERGEMVTGVVTPDPAIVNLAASPPTANLDENQNPDILSGAYQLEIRRTDEYISMGDPLNSVTRTFDTNARLTYQDPSTLFLADRNRERPQGVLIVDSNFITDSGSVGIHVQPGTPEGIPGTASVFHPGAVKNFPLLNTDRLVPGIVIQNNVIAGSSGISFVGHPSADGYAPVSFGRIVNNTLVGVDQSGTGIRIDGLASPTLLNNLLTGFETAIVNDGYRLNDKDNFSIIRANFFQDNVVNGRVGTAAIISPVGSPLFLDAASGNYILQPTSAAIDSSQDTEQDRFNFRNFKRELDIPPSPIFAPDRDVYGQLRVDSGTSPGGGGSDVFKDRGAIDRSDTDQPFAVLHNPIDNQAGLDRNPLATVVYLRQGLLENFTLLLSDGRGPQSPFEGTGVDGATVFDSRDSNVAAQAIAIWQNDRLLRQGFDYTIGYNPESGVLMLTPLATLWDDRSIYTIRLDNTRIADKQGNRLRPNQPDGTTQFTIIMPEVEFDFGDAPATYGTLLIDRAAYHSITAAHTPRLGALIDAEADGQPGGGDDVNGVDDEDGLLVGTLLDDLGPYTVFTIPGADPNDVQPDEVIGFLNPHDPAGSDINIWVTGTGLLDGWIDFDQDGSFDEDERIFDSKPVIADPLTGNVVTLNIKTPADALDGATWLRLRISETFGLGPNGVAIGGEVEDYAVRVHRFATLPVAQNEPPSFEITTPTIEILERDSTAPFAIDDFAINVYPGNPTSLNETVTQNIASIAIEKISGPDGLMTQDPQLAADGRLLLFPSADAVGSFVYAVTMTDDHPTDPQSTTKTFRVELRPVNDDPRWNSAVVPSGATNPADANDSYSVAAAGTITYTLREDNAQANGSTAPFFLPIHGEAAGPFNRIGLLDVFSVGPANEADGTFGGSQTLSLISPSAVPNQTAGGGRLEPVFDGPELVGWNYFPPADFNSDDNGIDSFAYTATDNGTTWNLATGTLIEDPRQRTNRVEFVIAAVNDAPTIDQIDDLQIDEDLTIRVIPLTGIRAGGNESQPLRVTAVSSNPTLFADPTVVYASPNSTGSLRLQPLPDQSGAATITVTVEDGGLDRDLNTTGDNASATRSFTVTVNPVNDPPTLDPISNVVLNEDAGQQSVNLTGIAAGGGEKQPLRITASGDNPNLISDPLVTYTSDQATGLLTFAPLADRSGVATITVWVEDGGLDGDLNSPSDNQTTSRTFTVTVSPNNDPPTLDPIGNLEIDEDAGTQTLNLTGISAGGGESQPLRVTATSSNPALIPDPISNYTTGDGFGTLSFVPRPDQSGTATITVTVTDGGLDRDLNTVSDNATFTRSFVIIVRPINDVPTLSVLNDRTVNEDSPVVNVSLSGIFAGGGELQPLRVTAVSSAPTLVPDPSIDYSSANATGTLRFAPVPDQSGTATITVTVTDGGIDGDLSTPADNATMTRSFRVTVNPVNDSPTIDLPTDVTVDEDTAAQTLTLTGIAAGGGESQPLQLTVSSANPALIPNPVITHSSADPTASLTFAPVADRNGTTTITVTVTDGGLDGDLNTSADNASVSRSFTITVNPVNDLPTLSAVNDQQIDEDSPARSVPLAGIGAGGGESQSLRVVAVSDNPTLISDPTILYAGASTNGTLTFVPNADQNGTATITVTVEDAGGDNDFATVADNAVVSRSFVVTVNPINDPPRFNFVGDDPISILEDSGPFAEIVLDSIMPGPADEAGQSVSFQLAPLPAQFASLFRIPPTIDAGGVLRFLTADQQNTNNPAGPVPLRVVATDSAGGQSAAREFQLVIDEVNDVPVAIDDPLTTDENRVLLIQAAELMANDRDPDLLTNAAEKLRIQLPPQSQTARGASLTYDDRTGQISYDPSGVDAIQMLTTGQTTTDTFTYSLIDAAGGVSNTATVTLSIAGINDPPTTFDDIGFLEPEGSSLINVLANDTEIDGTIDPTSLQIFAPPQYGVVVLESGGVILYTPHVDIPVVHSFSYTVADTLGRRSAPATVTFVVNAQPLAGDDVLAIPLGQSAARIEVTANDADGDGELDMERVEIVDAPQHGTAVSQADGSVMYETVTGFVGTDHFTYRVFDVGGRPSNLATVTLAVGISGLQNPENRWDVNHDGNVTALDALLILNRLFRHGSSEILVQPTDNPRIGVDSQGNAIWRYFDVNGDRKITAADALQIVNRLARTGGELEPPPLTTPVALVQSPISSPVAPADQPIVSGRPVTKIVHVSLPPQVSHDVIELIATARELDRHDELLAAIDTAFGEPEAWKL
jgi:VCBS repeat-containing protein